MIASRSLKWEGERQNQEETSSHRLSGCRVQVNFILEPSDLDKALHILVPLFHCSVRWGVHSPPVSSGNYTGRCLLRHLENLKWAAILKFKLHLLLPAGPKSLSNDVSIQCHWGSFYLLFICHRHCPFTNKKRTVEFVSHYSFTTSCFLGTKVTCMLGHWHFSSTCSPTTCAQRRWSHSQRPPSPLRPQGLLPSEQCQG